MTLLYWWEFDHTPARWPWRKQPSRKHFAFVQMPAKPTSRERYIFIEATAIMMALWLNWKLLARRCPIMLRIFAMMGFIQRRQGAGKSPHEIWSSQLSSTRATSKRC